jgi:hypothetical protein
MIYSIYPSLRSNLKILVTVPVVQLIATSSHHLRQWCKWHQRELRLRYLLLKQCDTSSELRKVIAVISLSSGMAVQNSNEDQNPILFANLLGKFTGMYSP